jgi:hypothetical protein
MSSCEEIALTNTFRDNAKAYPQDESQAKEQPSNNREAPNIRQSDPTGLALRHIRT